jgi:RNA polymerase sigma factor (sigma-70 family)
MKEVTESEFLEAYKNLDNTRIMNKVCSRYRNTIPHDEIERCKLVALWEAMKAFDPNGGRKFTSFLYNRIDWECKKEIQRINRHKKRTTFFIDGHPEGSHTPDYRNLRNYETVNMEEAIETLVPKYKNILHQRFFERMTMQEIADRNNYSRETARRYINIALEKLRECLPK